uniref:Uncharacterized protein n=1 Tax=Ananas comosus var. bracteatus TaxID=296719 RepID=A0A6V7QQR1_ANACO
MDTSRRPHHPHARHARLLAGRGAAVTFVTTPLNFARIKSLADSVANSGLPIHFLPLRFPCAECGLPDGCENIDVLPSSDLLASFWRACAMLREPLASHLRHNSPRRRPALYPIQATRGPGTSHGSLASRGSVFPASARLPLSSGTSCTGLRYSRTWPTRTSRLVFRICLIGLSSRRPKRGELRRPGTDKFREAALAEERRADGIVVNTFDDLEASSVGETAARGRASDVDVGHCLRWLDSKKHGSVVYVSFGSLARTMPGQLIQVGLGLEASERPFVWVIKAGDRFAEVEEWLKAEGFEERVTDRGLIIKGWAPQSAILSHPAWEGS